ncbi:AAA family ATPase [Deefgea rivuli]|uniref:AAA family ATPase n=1 Tax=Deefgea rivuli TaxID=400948 RepID=UPI0004832731|nr:ATP-binding protein [Deefgea rivuli]
MHLKSLHIKNFRALEDFQVSKLGRVNLIVGKNNSGKSSVLEALRIYAGNAHPDLLEDLAISHDEQWKIKKGEFEFQNDLPFKSFFSGRQFPEIDGIGIEIGDGTADKLVKIEHVFYYEKEYVESEAEGEGRPRVRRTHILKSELVDFEGEDVNESIAIQINDSNLIILRFGVPSGRLRPLLRMIKRNSCSYISTQFTAEDELADMWDRVGLTEAQEFVKSALRIVNPDFEEILFVRDDEIDERDSGSFSRSAIVKLKNVDTPVPLNSMGDGIFRILQLFLKLFAAKGGFLLVDEFENGLHYSVQEEVWRLVFDLAEKLDIQVFATTHSWDCIESFAKVAVEKTETEGVLFRVGRSVRTSDQGRVIATVFDEQKLFNITQSDVEVR